MHFCLILEEACHLELDFDPLAHRILGRFAQAVDHEADGLADQILIIYHPLAMMICSCEQDC